MRYHDVLYYTYDGEVWCPQCFDGDTEDDPEVGVSFAGEELNADVCCTGCFEKLRVMTPGLIRLYCKDADNNLLEIVEFAPYRAPSDLVEDIQTAREGKPLEKAVSYSFPYEHWDVEGCVNVEAVVQWDV